MASTVERIVASPSLRLHVFKPSKSGTNTKHSQQYDGSLVEVKRCKKCGRVPPEDSAARQCPYCDGTFEKVYVKKEGNIKMKCPFCLHTWIPRVEKPVECPRCKNRLDRRKRRLAKCFRNM